MRICQLGKASESDIWNYFKLDLLNKELGDVGIVQSLKYFAPEEMFQIIYTSKTTGQSYEMNVTKNGQVTIVNSDIDLANYELVEEMVTNDIYAFFYEDEKILAFNHKNVGLEGKVASKIWSNVEGDGDEIFPYGGNIFSQFWTSESELGGETYNYMIHESGLVIKATGWFTIRNQIEEVVFIDKIYPDFVAGWFAECKNLTSLENLENLVTTGVSEFQGLFYECSSLTSLDLSSFDTRNATNMKSMFYHCSNLTNLNLDGFHTENVKNFAHMFNECRELRELNLTSFKTFGAEDMFQMFYACSNLETVWVNYDNWFIGEDRIKPSEYGSEKFAPSNFAFSWGYPSLEGKTVWKEWHQ
ncbi:MAG: BspA family leucine-rich repeat surface protein [Clostridia bacterium]|nr:BspA family leucine-rich repeat surface protein [Clostridia bacterium]